MSDGTSLPTVNEKEIFCIARTLSAAQRATYLDGVCGSDPKLRVSVEALLQCDGEGDLFSNTSAIFLPNVTANAAIGCSIGRYKILGIIGEGGGGVVYRAEQDGHLHLQVALKIIKPGFNTDQQILRFKAEPKALAMMNSSHFAKVLDAGENNDGQPYFVMERVEGKAITTYVDAERFTLEQRLDLFVKVCKAFHDVHLKGFIHQDIKPSNILIATESGEPVPKVIDFGIAKPTVGALKGLEEPTAATGQLMGTPNYMSPEQSGESTEESDRKTDIYSLGVLLHELLIGCLPFNLDGLSICDQLRTIREKIPELPSVKYKLLAEKEALAIAQSREREPSQLVEFLQGEIDAIVFRCLQKKRGDRYNTALSLAVDIERWLKTHIHDTKITPTDRPVPPARFKTLVSCLWLLCLIGVLVTGLVVYLRRSPPPAFTADDISTPDSLMVITINTLQNQSATLTVKNIVTPDALMASTIHSLRTK